jgi:hypothetical protein
MGRSTKSKAEFEFDVFAKPISIKKFLTDISSEQGLMPFEEIDIEPIEIASRISTNESTEIEVERTIIQNAVIIQSISNIDDVQEFELDWLFLTKEESVVCSDPLFTHVAEVQSIINSELSNDNTNQFKISKSLNIARRCFSILSSLQSIAPQFCDLVLDIKQNLSQVKVNQLHFNDTVGIHELLDYYEIRFHENENLMNLFYKFKSNENLFINDQDETRQYMFHLVGNRLLNDHLNQPLPLSSMIVDVYHDYDFIPELNLTVEQLFRKLGIQFFDSFLHFSSWSRVAIPLASMMLRYDAEQKFFERLKVLSNVMKVKFKIDLTEKLLTYFNLVNSQIRTII